MGWHRANIIIPHLSRYVLLVLYVSSKIYPGNMQRCTQVPQNAAATDHTRSILLNLFEDSNHNVSALDWKAGHMNFVQMTRIMNIMEIKHIGILFFF
jgi:hypothetical protein